MATKADITPELLRQLLRYEPETGKLFWKPRSPFHFVSENRLSKEARADVFNKQNAGKMAFYDAGKGYMATKIMGVSLKAHRVAWAIYYGEWPDGQIDHINHNRSDNSIGNLRVVSNAENQRNGGMRSDNKSGVCGVIWSSDRNKWRARITVNGKIKNLGCFTLLADAVGARKAAEASYGFHPNHGQY